jgi:hypothetical protein
LYENLHGAIAQAPTPLASSISVEASSAALRLATFASDDISSDF